MFLLLLAASRAELHMGLLLLLSHCLPREFVELTLWGRLRRDNPSPLDGNSQQQPWAPDTSSRPPRVGAHEHGPAPHRQILGLQGWNADWATTARLSGLQEKTPREFSDRLFGEACLTGSCATTSEATHPYCRPRSLPGCRIYNDELQARSPSFYVHSPPGDRSLASLASLIRHALGLTLQRQTPSFSSPAASQASAVPDGANKSNLILQGACVHSTSECLL